MLIDRDGLNTIISALKQYFGRKVTELTNNSTDLEYPSAKATKDYVDEVSDDLKEYVDTRPKELPEVTVEDDGEVLTVVDGEWAKDSLSGRLPEVTSTDNGKSLFVEDGQWAVDKQVRFEIPVTLNLSTGKFETTVTPSQISDALDANQKLFIVLEGGIPGWITSDILVEATSAFVSRWHPVVAIVPVGSSGNLQYFEFISYSDDTPYEIESVQIVTSNDLSDFVITYTISGSSATADKTNNEIIAAINAGKRIVVKNSTGTIYTVNSYNNSPSLISGITYLTTAAGGTKVRYQEINHSRYGVIVNTYDLTATSV